LRSGSALLQSQHRFIEIGYQQPVYQKAGTFLDDDGDLAQLLGELLHGIHRVLVRFIAGDHFHQLHHVGRIEKVHADHSVRPAAGRSHLADGQG
jgi:hypothetical protein